MEDNESRNPNLVKKNLIHIEYCTNCQSHNWNTHHNEAKYHQTYIKLKNLIQDLFKEDAPVVLGNKVPNYLLPIKEQQNKYFNQVSKKYVFFPNVGSFEISLNGQIIFSKKKTNTWPRFETLLNDLSIKIYQKAIDKIQTIQKIKKAQNFQSEHHETQTDEKTIIEQSTTVQNRQNTKLTNKVGNFSLTDHFKTYHSQNFPKVKTDSYHYFDSSSTIKQSPARTRIDIGDIQGLRQALKTPNGSNNGKFLKNNDKEILIDLSSIEEQQGNHNLLSIYQSASLFKKNPAFTSHNHQLEPITSINKSEKSLSLRRFQDFSKDLKNVEKKFQNIEKKINFNAPKSLSLNQDDTENYEQHFKESGKTLSTSKYLQQLQQAISKSRLSQKQFAQGGKSKIIREFLLNPLQSSQVKASDRYDERYISPTYYEEHELFKNYQSKKFSDIEAYLKATNEEKNKKLKKIYGEWKVGASNTDYISFLENSKKPVLRESTNSSGRKTKRRNQQNLTSSSGSESFSSEKGRQQVDLQKNNQKHFKKNEFMKTSKVENFQERKSNKKNSFIIKHKSVGAFSKNQTQQISPFTLLNKQKFKGSNQSQKQNQVKSFIKKFSNEKNIQKELIKNYQNSRSLHTNGSSENVEDAEKDNYKKAGLPIWHTKNTLKKVYSKKQNKFQHPNNKVFQKSSDQIYKRLNKLERMSKKDSQKSVQNNQISKGNGKLTLNLEKKSNFQVESQKNQNKDSTKKIFIQEKNIKIENKSSNQKNLPKSLSKSKQNEKNKKHQQNLVTIQFHQFQQSIKSPKKQLSPQKEESIERQPQSAEKPKNFKISREVIMTVHQVSNSPHKEETDNDKIEKQAEIKLNNPHQEQKFHKESTNVAPKIKLNYVEQNRRLEKDKKLKKIKQEEKNRKRTKSGSSLYLEQSPINSLLNSSFRTPIQSLKELEIQSRERQGNKVDMKGPFRKIPKNQKPLQITEFEIKPSFENSPEKSNNAQNKQLNPKTVKTQKTKKQINLISQQNKSIKKDQVKDQKASKTSTKIQNKFLKNKTQPVLQKFSSFRESKLHIEQDKKPELKRNQKNTVIDQKGNQQVSKIKKVSKDGKQALVQNAQKSKKHIRSQSSMDFHKFESAVRSKSKRAHSYFKIEKQSIRNSDFLLLKKQDVVQEKSDEFIGRESKIKEKQSYYENKSEQKLASVAIQTMELHELTKYTSYLQGQKKSQDKQNASKISRTRSLQSRNSFAESVKSLKSQKRESVDTLRRNSIVQGIYSPMKLKVDKRKSNKKGKAKINKIESSYLEEAFENQKITSSEEDYKSKSGQQSKKKLQKIASQKEYHIKKNERQKEDKLQKITSQEEDYNSKSEQQSKQKLQQILEENDTDYHHHSTHFKSSPTKQNQQGEFHFTRQRALILKQLYNMDKELQENLTDYELLHKDNKMYQPQKDNLVSGESYLFEELQTSKFFDQIQNSEIILKPIEEVLKNQSKESQSTNLLQLFNPQNIQIHQLKSHSPYFTKNLHKVLSILATKNELLIARLFQDYKSETNFSSQIDGQSRKIRKSMYGVWLCINKIWRLVTVDNIIPAKCYTIQGETNFKPIFFYHQSNQLWPVILQKCLAKAVGGYSKMFLLSVGQLFSILTGSNHLFYQINENLSKNKNFLRQISESDKKNFVMICEKYSANLKEQHKKFDQQPKVFYLLSKKVVINEQKEQTLFKIKQVTISSMISDQPYYMRYDVFCQNFKLCEVLHLRQHHNYCSITLNRGNISARSKNVQEGTYFNVVQLAFDEQSFGSITVSNQMKSDFKTYLYKMENTDNQIMKLVGEASKFNKKQLFFDCFFQSQKYYLFIQSSNPNSVVTYMGENKPEIKIKQRILTNGLKNKSIEYLPVSSLEKKNRSPKVEKAIQKARISDSHFYTTSQSFGRKPQSMEDLREMFIGVLLEERRNN